MAWDIYGQPLRRGYCEVHPDVLEEFPCSVCMEECYQQEQKIIYNRDMEELHKQLNKICLKLNLIDVTNGVDGEGI